MKTKNIMKALAMAMLMPAMLFTACSKDKEVTPTIDDNTAKNGYQLQVTVNVTCENDDTPAGSSKTMRADYNGETKKLSFSTGDKLFVRGSQASAGSFAGTLDYAPATEKFSGTITTQNEYTGTADALFTTASDICAILLPAGYGSYGYLTIKNSGYNAYIETAQEYAFATSKAAAVEQFSLEKATSYSSGFALAPQNAILNFTITGLAASTNVAVALTGSGYNITKTVTTDGSGNATFGAGVVDGIDLNNLSLTVAGNPITLVSSSKVLVAGKIYNIAKNALIVNPAVGQVIGNDGKNYADAAAATAAGHPAVAMIVYVGSDNGESAPYNHGLALALRDANNGNTCFWKEENTDANHTKQTDCNNFTSESGLQYNATHNWETYPAFQAAISNNYTAKPTGCSTWFLASGYQWTKMIDACKNVLGTKNNYEDLRDGFSSVGGYNLQSDFYYSSSENTDTYVWYYYFNDGNGGWYSGNRGRGYTPGHRVRSCLAF